MRWYMRITEAEKKILLLIDRHDYITSKTLHALTPHRTQRYRLIRSLENKNIITRHTYDAHTSLWFYTDFGISFQKLMNPDFFSTFRVDDRRRKITPVHNTLNSLIDFKLLNDTSGDIDTIVSDKYLKQYYAENDAQIKNETAGLIRVPDGEFSYQGHTMAYENELSKKSKNRYRDLFSFFRDFEEYKRIYWFYRDPKLRDFLINLFTDFYNDDVIKFQNHPESNNKNIRNKKLHVFCDADDFLVNGFNATKKLLMD